MCSGPFKSSSCSQSNKYCHSKRLHHDNLEETLVMSCLMTKNQRYVIHLFSNHCLSANNVTHSPLVPCSNFLVSAKDSKSSDGWAYKWAFFFQTRQEVSSVICLSGLNRATLIIIYNHQRYLE